LCFCRRTPAGRSCCQPRSQHQARYLYFWSISLFILLARSALLDIICSFSSCMLASSLQLFLLLERPSTFFLMSELVAAARSWTICRYLLLTLFSLISCVALMVVSILSSSHQENFSSRRGARCNHHICSHHCYYTGYHHQPSSLRRI
jgi:hypothetical protein